MSIEAALAENTAALNKVAALLEASNAGRAAAVEKITEAAGGEPKPKGRTPGSKNKDKDEAPAADTTAKAPTIEDLRAAGAAFMGTDDSALKEKRKAFVKSLLDHFGVAKFVDIPAENYAQVIAWVAVKTKDIDATVDLGADEAEPAAEDDLMG